MNGRIGVVVGLGVLAVVAAISGGAATPATELPNGVRVTPAGTEVNGTLGLIPQEIALSPSGRWLATSNSGNDSKTVSIVDTTTNTVTQTLDLKRPSFAGIVFRNDETLFVSGGTYNGVYVLTRGADGKFALTDPPIPTGYFPAQLAFDPGRRFLYVTNDMSNTLTVVDAATRTVLGTVPTGDHPYGLVVTPTRVYVSNWGAGTITEYVVVLPTGVDPNPVGTTGWQPVPVQVGRIADVGAHPTAMALDAAGDRLYVTNGNSDSVSVVDTSTMKQTATVPVAPRLATGRVPLSSAPGALALSGKYLFVANGGNNALAALDTSRIGTGASPLLGYVPTGWYPSALRLVSGTLYYANAKGNGPTAGSAGGTGVLFQGRGTPPPGTMWHLPVATALSSLGAYTTQVGANNNWKSLPGDVSASGTPLTQIHHVVFVLRENKTFDEEFSDLPNGNGQQCQTAGQVATWHSDTRTYTCPDGKPPLLIYGAPVTPNNHRLASRYALLNNFTVDAETSIIGHQWANASQLSDFAQRTYGNTEFWTSQEPGFVPQNGVFTIADPGGGYIFDAVRNAGHSVRSYSGSYDASKVSVAPANLVKLLGTTDFLVPIGLDSGVYPDTLRVKEFIRDVKANGLADFSLVWLPDDHTVGGLPGNLTPQSQVATNDLATGQLVDFLSHSTYWPDTAVFVLEDDPQSGQDHVSGYRSIFMLASPYAKRKLVSNQHYDMSSLLRTIELIFGVPPISQNDLTIAPMTGLFTASADLTPYTAVNPEVPPTLNPPDGPFAGPSRGFDFSHADAAESDGFTAMLQQIAQTPDYGVRTRSTAGATADEQWASLVAADLQYRSLFP